MDEEDTRNYKEPCPQCSEVNWGLTDECKFYCKSCHTVIEKTKEIDASELFISNSKIQSVSKGLKQTKRDIAWDWYICEGFQFILLKQAEALQALGVHPQIKSHVMCNLWRRYLQKTSQAYCECPVSQDPSMPTTCESSAVSSNPDSEPEVSQVSETDGENASQVSAGPSTSASDSRLSSCSGSIDGKFYKKLRMRHMIIRRQMSMPMTLAFCYLSLLWVRASITLSDLLRLVFYHHVPYFNAEQYFPEKTGIYGLDVKIFEVHTFPVYRDILEMSNSLGKFLDLPRFPQITNMCYYHPNVLCMKYLMEANLPDELHKWTNMVTEKAGLDDVARLTYDPAMRGSYCIPYDVQAVAIIIVALKLLFALNDDYEWKMSKLVCERNQQNNDSIGFDFKKWNRTVRPCMDNVKSKLEEEYASFSWRSERVLPSSQKLKAAFLKRKRMARNLKEQFSKLAGVAPDAGNRAPSSFLFNWEEQNTDKICFRGHSLEGIAQEDKTISNYWLSSMKNCTTKFCDHWKKYDPSKFPISYDFVLSLFALILSVEVCTVHYEVCAVERKLFKNKPQ